MLFEAGFANFSGKSPLTIDYQRADRAPLLFISGGNDHAVPAPVQRESYRKHESNAAATTGYTLFEGRDHVTCGEPGWEAVADFALNWAQNPRGGVLA